MKPGRFFLTLAIIGTCFSSLSGIVPAHCQTMTATISKHKNGDEHYQNSIHIASKKIDIPSSWIGAVISVESNWTPRAVSFAGAVGLMQLMPKTYDDMHRQYGLGRDSFETHDNIMAGMAYLKQMHGKFGREGFLAAHNAGPGLYQKHLSGHRSLPRETRSYVAKLEAIFDGKMPKNRRENPSHDVAIWASSPLFAGGEFGDEKPSSQVADSHKTVSEYTMSDDVISALMPRSSGLFVSDRAANL